MSKITAKALVVQGGGPTAVINQSLVGVILESKKYTEITKIYGARHGVRGVINEDLVDLTDYDQDKLELIAQTPSSALGSTRDKPDEEYCKKMFEVMERHGIHYFFLIGGNDGSAVCDIVNKEAKKANYELRVIHVPKTIDNDLVGSDHTPGFGSAAKFIAQAFAGVDADNRALTGVYIGITMGRHAGFLTASSVLARKSDEDGPHLVYLPEKVFNIHHFVKDVKEVYEKYGRCVVAVSEGVADEDGVAIATKLVKQIEHDAHGNVQLSGGGALGDLLAEEIKSKTSIGRVRADTLGYLQRSFLGCVSEVDSKEAREVGEQAVRFAVSGDIDGSVVMERAHDYEIKYKLNDLTVAAGNTKTMPEEFFSGDNMVSEEFIKYARPLVGELSPIEFLDFDSIKIK
ncbi:MAG: 6-phosphofructokinase [Candidatus Magasanikbacteria bacterium]|jgi:ATP-dependent phosphofructokinase / diphosphate-dependent phosphofructokinase|nr:6-phosphofructokinase [Candidatus Magasanikbacteria bacterium]MBT4314583.1 6-phosphofructokinase [Candidatus Magasanikbacteria bacterium]MBT4546784.1 6-phosphofructokinase [Candidatus Magasanikbacteria bacterium]MBT6818793.1 6-phosphofructokinase [Candidatus Magasanikbacteria bacterium]